MLYIRQSLRFTLSSSSFTKDRSPDYHSKKQNVRKEEYERNHELVERAVKLCSSVFPVSEVMWIISTLLHSQLSKPTVIEHLKQLAKEKRISQLSSIEGTQSGSKRRKTIRRRLKFSKISSGLDILNTSRVGATKEIASRYSAGQDEFGVIVTITLNPTSRMMFSVPNAECRTFDQYAGFEEEFEDPLDEIILDHYLRGIILEFAYERNCENEAASYLIDPPRLANGDISSSEAGQILRSLPLHRQEKFELLFHIDIGKLETFLQTPAGRDRLAKALRAGSQEFRNAISSGKRGFTNSSAFHKLDS